MSVVKTKEMTPTELLSELHAGSINFVLLGDGVHGYSWYVPNPWGPLEYEDWIFHALREGTAASLDEAVTQLCKAAVDVFPDTDYAKRH